MSVSYLARHYIGFLFLPLSGSHILDLPTQVSSGSKSTGTKTAMSAKTHRAHRLAQLYVLYTNCAI